MSLRTRLFAAEPALYTHLRALADVRLDQRRTASGGRTLPQHLRTGEQGEAAAYFHLRAHGYTIVARRWTTRRWRGDLDLVAWDGDTLVVFEIKTRTTRDLYPAELAVDRDKREQLRKLARSYVARFPEIHRSRIRLQFDVLAVYLGAAQPEFDHFPAMFYADPD